MIAILTFILAFGFGATHLLKNTDNAVTDDLVARRVVLACYFVGLSVFSFSAMLQVFAH